MKEIKFLITQESERLGRWLRILGFDVAIFKEQDLKKLYAIAYAEDRAVVTRNFKIKKAPLLKIVHIKSQDILMQMKEAVKKLRLKIKSADIFHRCSLCNRILKDITRLKVKNRVPVFVYKTQKYFSYCSNCKKIYWQGTHRGKVIKTLKAITESNQKPAHRNQILPQSGSAKRSEAQPEYRNQKKFFCNLSSVIWFLPNEVRVNGIYSGFSHSF